MTRSKDRFEELLQSDSFAGHIIRWVAIFETRLDCLLAAYFVAPQLYVSFDELVLSKLSFYEKIEILRGVKFNRPLKSHKNIVDALDKLRKLRNALAHSSYMEADEIKKLRSDKWIVDFVTGYPATVGREKNSLENRFSLLWKHCYAKHKNREDA